MGEMEAETSSAKTSVPILKASAAEGRCGYKAALLWHIMSPAQLLGGRLRLIQCAMCSIWQARLPCRV